MAEGDEVVDLVADILTTPFSRKTFQEKLDIVKRGRPTPTLGSFSLTFHGEIYAVDTPARCLNFPAENVKHP